MGSTKAGHALDGLGGADAGLARGGCMCTNRIAMKERR